MLKFYTLVTKNSAKIIVYRFATYHLFSLNPTFVDSSNLATIPAYLFLHIQELRYYYASKYA